MPDLQHVDRLEQAPGRERGLDRRLRVAGQQCREAPELEPQDDGAVVDVTLGKGRVGVLLRGIEDARGHSGAKVERLAGPEQRDLHASVGRIGQQSVIGRIAEGNSGVEHRPDPEPVQDVDQSGDVVLVRVADHEQVDAPREEGQVRTNPAQRQLRFRTAVDQHRPAVWRLDEDRVALADIEHRQVEEPVWARGDRDRQQQRH